LKAEGGFGDTLNVDANGPRGQTKPIIDGHGTALARDAGVEPAEQPGSRRGKYMDLTFKALEEEWRSMSPEAYAALRKARQEGAEKRRNRG
jgi:hypothetical protein